MRVFEQFVLIKEFIGRNPPGGPWGGSICGVVIKCCCSLIDKKRADKSKYDTNLTMQANTF